MPRNRELHEIVRTRFWELEDFLKSDEGKRKFPGLKLIQRGQNKVYQCNAGKLLEDLDGVCFAHHSLESSVKG